MSSGLQKDPSPFSVTSQHTGHVRRIAGLLFGRHLFNSTLLVLFCFALSGAIVSPTELIRDPDVWWHLANARLLFATHHFLRADPYSFTLHGQPWANPAWLGEVPYWLSYRWLGMRGVHLLAVLVLCANVLFVYFRSCAKSRHIVAAFWMAVPGIFLIAVNAGARTIGFAYLALSAEMALRGCGERPGIAFSGSCRRCSACGSTFITEVGSSGYSCSHSIRYAACSVSTPASLSRSQFRRSIVISS